MALTGLSIQTSKGEGYGNKDTEDFEVEKLAVDISGPPYVIIDNGPGTLVGYPNPVYVPPPNVDSTYTAYATGGSGNYTWSWSLSDNIQFDGSYSTDNPVDVYGVAPAGPGDISCEATDTTTGSTQYGNRHPFVHDEYDTIWDNETDGPSGLPTVVGEQAYAPAGSGTIVTVTAGSSVAVEVGGSVSGDIPETDFGLDLSYTQTFETDSSSSVEVDCPANTQATYWEGCLVPMVFTLYGTGEKWGPNGVVDSDNITKVKAASPEANAEDETGGGLAQPDPTLPVNPVQPW